MLSEQTIVTLVVAGLAAVPPTATAFFAYLASRRANETSKKNAVDIQGLKVTVDGRLTQLLEITSRERHAVGLAEGISSERDRTSLAAVATTAEHVAQNVESIATDIGAVKNVLAPSPSSPSTPSPSSKGSN